MSDMTQINTTKCMARTGVKYHQCTRRKKNGDYCGTHLKQTNILRIDENLPASKQKKYDKFVNNINNIKLVSLQDEPQNLDYYVRNTSKITKIQAVYKAHAIRKMNKMRGPAFKNRLKCNNSEDMYLLEPICEIHPNDFYSFNDEDGFMYGFHIESIFKHVETSSINPYNNNIIPKIEIQNIKNLYKYSKIHGIINFIDNTTPNDPEFLVRSKLVNIFQKMDQLNNYKNIQWFLDLNVKKLETLFALIKDLWGYRMELTPQQHKNLVKDGKLFTTTYHFPSLSLTQLQNILLDIMDRLVNEGKTREDQYLGSLIILSGLVDIHFECAESYPWLVQSTFG
jgi:hypothetical protein